MNEKKPLSRIYYGRLKHWLKTLIYKIRRGLHNEL